MATHELTLKINADEKKAVDALLGLSRATKKTEDSFKKATGGGKTFSGSLSLLRKSLGGVIGPLVAGATVAGIVKFTSATLKSADSIAKTSDKLGIATDLLQVYRYAAGQAGVEQTNLDNSLRYLNKSIGEAAQGTKEYKDNFDRLGVSVTDSNGNIRDTNAILYDLASGFARTESQAEKTALAMGIFGRSGTDMLNLIGDGSSKIVEAEGRLRSFNGVLEDDLLRSAEKANDAMDDMTRAFSTGFQRAVLQGAETMAEASTQATSLGESLGSITTGAIKATTKVTELVSQFKGFISSLNDAREFELFKQAVDDQEAGKSLSPMDIGLDQNRAIKSAQRYTGQRSTVADEKAKTAFAEELRGKAAEAGMTISDSQIDTAWRMDKQKKQASLQKELGYSGSGPTQNMASGMGVPGVPSSPSAPSSNYIGGTMGQSWDIYNQGMTRFKNWVASENEQRHQRAQDDTSFDQAHGAYGRKFLSSGSLVMNVQNLTLQNPQEAAKYQANQMAMSGGEL